MKTCPRCQLPNDDAAARCRRCDTSLAVEQQGIYRAGPPAPPLAPPELPTGRFVGSMLATAVLLPIFLAPAFLAATAGAHNLVVVFLGLVGWAGLFPVVSLMLWGGRYWKMGRSLVTAFGVYAAGHGIALVGGAVFGVVWMGYRIIKGSCPHVYTFDGTSYQLDADPLSGAFGRGAERDDLVRLEKLRDKDGKYQLEIRDELPEKDAIDALDLVVVDHPPAVEALPTADGKILGLSRLAPPASARDASGADRLAAVLHADDGAFFAASLDPAADGVDAATLELSFPRPADASSLALALRAHNTPFAETAFGRYLASMGPGLAPLMGMAQKDCCYSFNQRIHDEMEKLGLPMVIEVDAGDGYRLAAKLDPVGPAIQRTQAVPLPALANAKGPVRVRLRFTPRFWAVDAVHLGEAAPLATTATLRPTLAQGPRGDALGLLRLGDGERVELSRGERMSVAFDAPAAPREGEARTVLLRIRGYYEMDLGSAPVVNPTAIVAHDSGLDSLPRFAARLARKEPALVVEGVR
jgi:hypothetical protein